MQLFGAEQEVLQVARYVAADAVDHHLVVAPADVLHHRFIEIELGALLVVVGHLEPAAALDPPVLGLDFSQQRLDERGLAGTVGPDQPDTIAAHDACGEIANDDAAVELDAQVLDLEHQCTGLLGAVLFEFDAAGTLTPCAALRAQLVQGAHPALVTGASRLHSLADPDLFLCQFLVEQRLLLGFCRQLLRLDARVVIVIAAGGAECAAIQFHDARGQAVDECAVVTDEQQGAGKLQQELLQPLDRLDVKMISRLVEQQDVRLRHQCPGEQRPPPPAAGQFIEAGGRI